MANGVETRQGYDRVGRLASLGYDGDDDIASFSLRYDKAGNLVGKNRSSYEYDERNRLRRADEEGRYSVDARDRAKAVTFAARDTVGDAAMAHIALDTEVRLDQGTASVGIDLGASYEVSTLTATPLSDTHRVEERNIAVFVSTYGSDFIEVTGWSFATLPNGSLHIRFAGPVKARHVKLHCRYDERNEDGSSRDVSTFRNAASSIVTVGYYETSRLEKLEYDDQGNRESVEISLGGMTDSVAYGYYDDSDRVKKSGDRAYVHDAAGNMTERGTSYSYEGSRPVFEIDGYYRSYGYDLQNRLVRVSGYRDGALVTLATYAYAGDNLRLSKTSSGKTTRYVHGVDGNELYRATGTDSTSTVWLFGKKLAEVESKSGTVLTTYLHTDHIGTVVSATDEDGKTIWTGDNTAFGISTADTGTESRAASYTGKDYDSEAGLYYFNARWYDAELARFTTEDPARDDINWYVYCANNPMTYTDPTGLANIIGDDINSDAIIDSPNVDLSDRVSIEVVRDKETGHNNDTAKLKIGNQTVEVYSGVQSEKNLKAGSQTSEAERAMPDYSEPDYPNATLPVGDYTGTRTGGDDSKYPGRHIITSDTAQLPGFSRSGIRASDGMRVHSQSERTKTRTDGWSLGCQIFKDIDFESINKNLSAFGIENGDSYLLRIR